jgi:hypothetical protein
MQRAGVHYSCDRVFDMTNSRVTECIGVAKKITIARACKTRQRRSMI